MPHSPLCSRSPLLTQLLKMAFSIISASLSLLPFIWSHGKQLWAACFSCRRQGCVGRGQLRVPLSPPRGLTRNQETGLLLETGLHGRERPSSQAHSSAFCNGSGQSTPTHQGKGQGVQWVGQAGPARALGSSERYLKEGLDFQRELDT